MKFKEIWEDVTDLALIIFACLLGLFALIVTIAVPGLIIGAMIGIPALVILWLVRWAG